MGTQLGEIYMSCDAPFLYFLVFVVVESKNGGIILRQRVFLDLFMSSEKQALLTSNRFSHFP